MFGNITIKLARSIISASNLKQVPTHRSISRTHLVLAKKPDYDARPDNVFNILKTKDTPSSDLTEEKIDELSKLGNNAFKLFGLEEKLNLSPASLKREMRKLQQLLHPDKVYDADKSIKERAHNLSALVNDSYEILRHPYKRAKYLLSIVSKKSQDDIEKDLDKLKIDPDFLARMMEMREELENGSITGHDLHRLELELSSELNSLMRELNTHFDSKEIEVALTKLGKLKFLANCHQIVSEQMGSFSQF